MMWYNSSPGDTIKDILTERDISIDSFSWMIGKDKQFVMDLIDGKEKITWDIAIELSTVLGSTPLFWWNREFNYRNPNHIFKTMENR